MSVDTAVAFITADDMKTVLHELADNEPDRVDPCTVDEVRPRYLGLDGQPNSLVAHVLLKLGLDTTVLRQMDHEFPLGELLSSGVRISESRHPALSVIDSVALRLLDYLQDCQDCALTWSQALDDAYAKVPRLIPQRFVRDRRPWMFA